MISYSQRGNRIVATVRVTNSPSKSKSFLTKREAKVWAIPFELEMKAQNNGVPQDHSLEEAIYKYIEEVAPTHKGGDTEVKRLKSILDDDDFPKKRSLSQCDDIFWTNWIKKRLKTPVKNRPNNTLSSGTVRREVTILRSVYEYVRIKYKWIKENPFNEVKKPKDGKSRERIITDEEVDLMFQVLKYERGGNIVSIGQQVGAIFDLALHTGMRMSEITKLQWRYVFLDQLYIHLPETKNGQHRDVPLLDEAVQIMKSMVGVNDDEVFAPDSQTLSAYFRKARKKASLSGFTFHDSRHTAATKIAALLTSKGIQSQQAVMDFCKIFGWKDMNNALIYYNPSPTDIAMRMRGDDQPAIGQQIFNMTSIKPMTEQEAIIRTGYTGILYCDFSLFLKDVSNRLGRNINIEGLRHPAIWDELKAAYRNDFLNL